MNDYELRVTFKGKFYCVIQLKADFRQEAIEQSNEIMNRFPEPEYKAAIYEIVKYKGGVAFSFFN